MDWDDFKFVQAVARAGSVRGAGDLLHVHGSTVARHLDQLERRVGAKLFSRTPRGMEITAAGAEVIETLDRVAAELDRVERRLQSQGPALAGTVTLALPAELAGALVVPALPGFRRQQPDIELDLATGPALPRLQDGSADLALCVTGNPPQDLIGRSLGPVMAAVYGRPDCLAALDAAAGEAAAGAAGSARWIGPGEPRGLSERIYHQEFPALPRGLRAGDPAVLVPALQSGLGIALLPCYLGDSAPGLVRAPVPPVREGDLWLFSRPETRGLARIQALAGFLQTLFEDLGGRLSGALDAPA